MRIGQALGLRHEDFVTHERRIEIVPREDNANGARGKLGEGSVPVSGELVRCYSDYMHEEYGDLDSDYVFVNLWGGQVGRAMTYPNVVDIVARTRARVGFHFTAHMLRLHLRNDGPPWRGADGGHQHAADAHVGADDQRHRGARHRRGPARGA